MESKIRYFVLSLLFFAVSQLQAQTNSKDNLKDFKITIEITDDGITMKSIEGSAWLDLTFSLKEYNVQAVDEYGMTKLDNVSERKDVNLADFLFTITKTNEGADLKGIEGTAWKELSFNIQKGRKIAIDQYGMTSLN